MENSNEEKMQKIVLAWQNACAATAKAILTKAEHIQVEQDMIFLGKKLGVLQDKQSQIGENEEKPLCQLPMSL